MSNIDIKKEEGQWVASYNGKRIGGSGCKACILKVIMAITAKTDKYKTVTVYSEHGDQERVILTGVQ